MEEKIENNFRQGFKDGLPIGLGYLSVSFTFGMIAIAGGMPIEVAVLISLTNMTSAGQFAGLTLMFANGSLIEMALTQLVINIRYALMSLSLSQKLAKRVTTPKRCLIAFANTDEIFAVASSKTGKIGEYYMYGLAILPIIGWTSGTFLGAAINSLLPTAFQSAFGIAIYGMFIAIVVPPAKHSKRITKIVIFTILLSCMFAYVPIFKQISSGFAIILCAVIASALGAYLFPIEEVES
ncbi:MAG: AzlC family ABC transporter permease [Erysipelotrichaceae bacterium]